MNKRLGTFWYIFLVAVAVLTTSLHSSLLLAKERITIGVHGYDAIEQSNQDWTPLASYLSSSMRDYEVSVIVLDHASMQEAIHHHRLDFLLTDSSIFVQIRESNSMARAVADVVANYRGKPVIAQAGVIVVRGESTDITEVTDLLGKRIACDSEEHLLTYQAQVHQLLEAGIDIRRNAQLVQFDDEDGFGKVKAVMEGKTDAAFIRGGYLEELVDNGRLNEGELRIVNRQRLPGYPYAVSTRLYADRVMVMLPHVSHNTAQRMVTALYSLEASSPALRSVGIYGFTLPSDYAPVVAVARDLKIRPFNAGPDITLPELWQQYSSWISTTLLVIISMVSVAIILIVSNHRLKTANADVRLAKQALETSEQLLRNSLEEIKASNERFNLVMRASNDGVWDWDFITDHVYYSPRWFSMLGYEEGELETKFSTWEQLINVADRDLVMSLVHECVRGERDGFEVECLMRHKDGSWRDILTRGVAVRNSTGHIIRFAGTHMDITEHKSLERSLRQKEHQLVTIIDHLPLILFVKDAHELRYVRFNRYGEELLGQEHGFYIGKNDYDLYPKERADSFVKQDMQVLTTLRPLEDESDYIDTSAGRRYLHTRKLAIVDDTGVPQYVLGISEDVTERIHAQQERTRLSRELQQSQKMESLGQLTGGIAHDFNNLLGIISGYSGLALEYCERHGDAKVAGYMRQLLKASERATRLIAQMLTFSRIDQSEDSPIQFAPLIKEDIKMLRATFPTTIEMVCEIAENLPPIIMNPTQLHQILTNLSINARDAMGGDGVLKIRLDWARNLNTESPVSHRAIKGDWIELSVSDSGSGIAPEILPMIFNPFFTTKEVGKGTGLGLSVIYSIMEAHDGRILIDTGPQAGTTFRMLFKPYLAAERSELLTLAADNEIPYGDGSELLVVDDEESIALFMTELLNLHGYKATYLSDSEAALALLEHEPHRFAVLITDQTMPHLTGVELIRRARMLNPALPAILCTGYSDKIDAAGAEALGIPFFEKPVDHEQLLKAIAHITNDKHH